MFSISSDQIAHGSVPYSTGSQMHSASVGDSGKNA
jgi:hypothetical protein